LTRGSLRAKLAGMQTLGLSGESRRSDGRLKSIFWPTVDNAWDVNYLGQQGFWICVIVALIEAVAGAFSSNPVILAFYLAVALIFFVGGMGVRQASWPAAAIVFSLFFTGLLYMMALGRLPGILSILAAGILLSNLRAAFLASEWRPAGEGEDRPTRFSETIVDKIVDQLPAKLWPHLQPYFFAVAAALLALELIGLGSEIWHRLSAFSAVAHP
jgi:K+-sensing histidine kinase KdpD